MLAPSARSCCHPAKIGEWQRARWRSRFKGRHRTEWGAEMDQELLNGIISTSVGGAAGGAVAGLVIMGIQWGASTWATYRDSNRVFRWLQENSDVRRQPFRTTRAIASHNNLTEDRVRFICSHDSRIMLSTGREEDRWSIHIRNRTHHPVSGTKDDL